jgi:hypothetical protein
LHMDSASFPGIAVISPPLSPTIIPDSFPAITILTSF